MDDIPKKKSIVSLLAWTSSIAAAIVIGVFIFQHFSQPSYEQLAQRYWPYEEGLPVKMSTSSKYDEAMNAFKLKDWEKAEQLLLKMDSDTANYFLGVIAYERQNHEQSAQYFWQVENNSRYYQASQFRLALVSIIKGDIDLAKLILQAHIEHQSAFASVSKEILEKIR
jgi:TolA-binding protein